MSIKRVVSFLMIQFRLEMESRIAGSASASAGNCNSSSAVQIGHPLEGENTVESNMSVAFLTRFYSLGAVVAL